MHRWNTIDHDRAVSALLEASRDARDGLTGRCGTGRTGVVPRARDGLEALERAECEGVPRRDAGPGAEFAGCEAG